MRSALDGCSEEDLKVAHAKLFVGPFTLAAPPYGSVYLDEGRRVMGDTTMDVIACYEKEGLVSSDACKDLPDHIAIELEFMAFLICKELDAHANSDSGEAAAYAQKQKAFKETYVLPWVPEFCEKIRQGTDNAFYRALADCASTVVRQEPHLQDQA